MPRAPFQILVIPFIHLPDSNPRYALFRRVDNQLWQFIAGGGENNESPQQAASREAFEEAAIPATSPLIPLQSQHQIPTSAFPNNPWPPTLSHIPEHTFAIDLTPSPPSLPHPNPANIQLSAEHTHYRWHDYQTALNHLHWQSNRTALTELHTLLTSPQAIK
ncbi:NUDIX hydrolase [Poriferisphaera corsica]|nr:NUDIX pyrophosphatase [Poriferisphaera corsica]